MPRRADAYRGLAHASRLRVFDAILERPGICLIDLSAHTGLHENTLRDHVRVLEAEGLVRSETQHRPSRGRPRAVFHAVGVDDMTPEAARRIADAKMHGDLLRRMTPAESTLDEEALHQLDALYEHLDDSGLSPELDEDALTVTMRPCRFHGLVDGNGEIVCRVHEELIRRVLGQAGGPVELAVLHPYETEHSCFARLAIRTDAAAPQS